MPVKSNTDDWILSIRTFIKDTIGASWQIIENKGKARLGIRFKDGTRTYTYLPYKWQRANQGKIRDFIEQVHTLHVKKKIGIKEAIERVKASAPQDEIKKANKTDFKLILEAWNKWGEYLTTTTGKVSSSTFKNSYGQTYKALARCSQSEDIDSLLMNVGKQHESGCRTRQQNVRRVVACLRWACSSKGKFILDADIWTPPREGELGDFIGRKSRELQIKTDRPTTPISDEDFLLLLDSLQEKLNDKNANVRAQAEKWDLALRLTRVFGLRPIELQYLQIRRNGKDCLWCIYPKQTSNYATKPRRLFPIHKNWCEEWKLIEKVRSGAPLPKMASGGGQAFGTYFRFNKVWKKLQEEKGISAYSLRHAWATVAHAKYNLNATILAPAMGHSVEVHNRNYSKWYGEDYLEDIFEKATQS